jgi:hypothetical protein
VSRNPAALWSVVVGLLGAAALPAAVVFADRNRDVELIWSAAGVPAALLLGLGALALARRGRRRAELTLLRRRGSGAARVGRLLGVLALLLAGTGTTALLVYALLAYRGSI